MTVAQMYQLISSLQVPTAYQVFKTPQTPPYICIAITGSDNFFADNSVGSKVNHWMVELYTDKKDPVTEASLEAVLPPWNKSEDYLDDEQLYLTTYEFDDVEDEGAETVSTASGTISTGGGK